MEFFLNPTLSQELGKGIAGILIRFFLLKITGVDTPPPSQS